MRELVSQEFQASWFYRLAQKYVIGCFSCVFALKVFCVVVCVCFACMCLALFVWFVVIACACLFWELLLVCLFAGCRLCEVLLFVGGACIAWSLFLVDVVLFNMCVVVFLPVLRLLDVVCVLAFVCAVCLHVLRVFV